MSVTQGFSAIEFAICIDGQMIAGTGDFEHGLQPAQVLLEWQAADLHLQHCIAGVEMPAHLVLQVLDCLARPIPAAAHVAEHLFRNIAAIEALGEHGVQRLIRNLGDRVPYCYLNGANSDRALGMSAGLFTPHHAIENFRGSEIAAGIVEQRVGFGSEDARNETRAHLRAAGIAARGIEGKAAHRFPITTDVVISVKSKLELASAELSGTAVSRISTMRIYSSESLNCHARA